MGPSSQQRVSHALLAEGADGGLVIQNDRIVELIEAGGSPAKPVDETFDASRHVVIPGLVNTHHHMFQTLTRAHPAAINKELFPWLQSLFPIWARSLDPQAFRIATRLALVELLMSGCTCVSDHQYLFPPGLDSAMDIQAEEARALGMRITLTRGSLDLTEQDGGNAPSAAAQDPDEILADCERVISLYHDRSEGAMTRVALAPCAPFNVSKRLMIGSAQLAEARDCRLHTHLDALRWATEGSAKCLGRDDIGSISIGKQADLALFTLDELRFSGAGDPIAALVLCGAHRADRVMIGGRWRVVDGEPLGVDVSRLRQDHGSAAKAFLRSL